MTARLRVPFPALLALILTLPAAAQPRRPITGEGTEGFRAVLVAKGLQPLESLEELTAADPDKVIIVAFHGADDRGNLRDDSLAYLRRSVNLRQFVDKGGALFVATDQATDQQTRREFDAYVTGKRVEGSGVRRMYLGNRQCPYLVPVDHPGANLFAARDGGILEHVATNKPSYLESGFALHTVAVFPRLAVRPVGQTLPDSGELPVVQFDVDDRSGGKFLVVADHSIFINSMLLPRQEGNDNLQFASSCVDWLMTGRPRSYVLFIEDGQIWKRDDYNLILQSLPGSNPDDIAQFLWDNKDMLWKDTDLAENLLANIEDSGILDEVQRSGMISDLVEDFLKPWMVARFLMIVGAVGLFGYTARAFMGSRYRFPKGVPRLSLLLDRLRPRAGVLELRLRSGLGRGRYYELARQKAREMFADLKLTPAEEGPMPKVEIDSGWWRRGRIMRDLREVWTIAFGREPIAVTARQWSNWLKKLDQIDVMIRHGVIRFA